MNTRSRKVATGANRPWDMPALDTAEASAIIARQCAEIVVADDTDTTDECSSITIRSESSRSSNDSYGVSSIYSFGTDSQATTDDTDTLTSNSTPDVSDDSSCDSFSTNGGSESFVGSISGDDTIDAGWLVKVIRDQQDCFMVTNGEVGATEAYVSAASDPATVAEAIDEAIAVLETQTVQSESDLASDAAVETKAEVESAVDAEAAAVADNDYEAEYQRAAAMYLTGDVDNGEDQQFDPTLEPLLVEDKSRFVVFPIHYPDVWDSFKRAEASVWSAGEIDLSHDKLDWEKLTDNERHFLKHVLAFFAASDGIVSENLAQNFCTEVMMPEARSFYALQIFIETVHNETYSTLIDTYVECRQEKARIFKAIDTMPGIKLKAQWALQWIGNATKRPIFPIRVAAFAIVEGLLFSTSFAAIFWIKNQNRGLNGLTFSNELIARDEGLHTDFACLLFRKYVTHKPSQSRIANMVSQAVNVEKYFIKHALPVDLLGMNYDMMAEYIEFVADRLMVEMGYEKLYNTPNPLPFMEALSLEGKTNFFEKKVGEYKRANVLTSNQEFTTDADF